MPHVVIQSCCADASCVVACPVNCIHPAPGEPGFGTSDILYVDAATCVDCGACTTACPADAIVPHTTLTPAQQPFLALNAEYYDAFPHADRTPIALVAEQRRLTRPGPFRVAVVGAGPAGMYAADELLKHPEVTVDVIDRLPTPYGLVRFGVAPDHQHTKQVAELFRKIEHQPGFSYLLGVEVGRDLSHADLTAAYDAVIYSVGAASDRSLGVPGEHLPGSLSATDVVAWYSGHPDRADLAVPLDSETAVVIGNGNVALDVARILTTDPDLLASTDIAALPLEQLRRSRVRTVVLLGRRGPDQAAFTVPELVGLHAIAVTERRLNVVVETGDMAITGTDTRSRLLREMADTPVDPALRTLVLRFGAAPVEICGTGRVEALVVERTRLETAADGGTRAVATGERGRIETGLVLRAIGYRGLPLDGLPYDRATGVVPHDRGRVRPGVYVAGWIKRGPTGFIGTNKTDAEETVHTLLDDLDAGLLPQPEASLADLREKLAAKVPAPVDLVGWQAIDAEEVRRGRAQGRARSKIVDVAEATRIASAAAPGSARRRTRRLAGT